MEFGAHSKRSECCPLAGYVLLYTIAPVAAAMQNLTVCFLSGASSLLLEALAWGRAT